MSNRNSMNQFFDRLSRKKGTGSFISSLVAIGIGLIIGLIILLISNPREAFAGFFTMLIGGFNDGTRSFGNVFYIATPIIMTGLAVGFAFKTGLFNIGGKRSVYRRGICCGTYRSKTSSAGRLPVGFGHIGRHGYRNDMGSCTGTFKGLSQCSRSNSLHYDELHRHVYG